MINGKPEEVDSIFMLQSNQIRHYVSELKNTIYKANKQSLSKRRLKNKAFRNKQRYFLQDLLDCINKLLSTAIMGLIVIPLLLALLLTLNALRSQKYFYRKEDCTTKQNKEKKRKSRQRQMETKIIKYYNPLNIMNKKQFQKMTRQRKATRNLYYSPQKMKNHHITQGIKNLQETIQTSNRTNIYTLPPQTKLTETVNFLKKGRNVADTLWSAHILQKISYLLGINNAKQLSLKLTKLPFPGNSELVPLSLPT